jgi:hypothetical protein
MSAINDVRKRQQAHEAYRRRVEEEEAQARNGWTADEWRKVAVGGLGFLAGREAGAAREAVKTAADVGAGVLFAGRLLNPLDPLLSPPDDSAWAHTVRAVGDAADYARDRASHPDKLRQDVKSRAQQFVQDIIPTSGFAPTWRDQLARDFRQGERAGATSFDVGTTLAGVGAEVKTLRQLGYIGKAATVADYMAQGATPAKARYLAAPYNPNNMGSHGLVSRKATLPGGAPVPKAFLDSKWNRTMPAPGATNGQMYRYHFAIDPSYWGGRVSKEFGRGGWSGKKLGWTKDGWLERRWRGTPLRTKAAAGALAGVGASQNPFLWPGDD